MVPLPCMLAISITLLTFAHGLIEEGVMPAEMSDCFQRYSVRTSLSKTVGQSIDWFCVDLYLWKNAKYSGWQGFNVTKETIEWFNRLTWHPTKRHKRQSVRLRREYRMLEDFERANFHRAIQMLKTDTVGYSLIFVHTLSNNNVYKSLYWKKIVYSWVCYFQNVII